MSIIFTSKRSIAILIFLVIGILFIIMPSKKLMPIVFWIIAISLTLTGVLKLTFLDKLKQGKDFYFDLIEGFISIIVGIFALNFRNFPHFIFVLGIVYAIIPCIRVFYSKNKTNQLLIDCLKYLVIFIMLTSSNFISKISYIIVGSLFIGVSILICITLVKKYNNLKMIK